MLEATVSNHNPDSTPVQLSFDDLEEWRDIPNWVGFYQVSSKGKIKRIWGWRGNSLRSGTPSGRYGYWHIGIQRGRKAKREYFYLHVLVALAFIGPCPDGMEVNHIDGNKNNNAISNLEYITHAANVKHSFNLGRKGGRKNR